jgi:16S rRNA (guanine966-N2)-methyltransferase
MRIVGGEFRGRPLATPRTSAIRPTTDRTREAVFNVLAHRFAEQLDGARVLDLFAGTGALGLEALSRGASYGVFIEESAEGRGLIRDNVEAFGLTGRTKIFRRDATGLGEAGTLAPFGLVFADPPYGKGLGEQALASAQAGGWLAPGALIVWEEAAEADTPAPAGFEELERREYGDAKVSILALRA